MMFIFKQVLKSKRNAVALQEVDVFFLKCLRLMMLFLIPDVFPIRFDRS